MSYTAIVDYGVGNLKSVANAMQFLGMRTLITGDAAGLERADSIILPGVGAFPDAAERLRGAGLDRVLAEQSEKKPILGICLGHQAICEVFGAAIVHAKKLMHGKQSIISLNPGCPLFAGLPDQIPAARYHSLIASRETLPDELLIAAQDDMGEIMAVQHRKFPIYGLQFHPESIMTPDGMVILKNFLEVIL